MNSQIDIPSDKYLPITGKWINSFIDGLYKPFKLFCDPQKMLFETNPKYPKYSVENKCYDGGIYQIQYGSNGWILFEPSKNEYDKIEAFKFIEEKRRKLVELSVLQFKLTDKSISHREYLDIKKEVDLFFDEVFSEIEVSIIKENNVTYSTIEDWLDDFKSIMSENDYNILVNSLMDYFKNGNFPSINRIIKVGRVNKKKFGWHLNMLFKAEGKGIEIELLRFAKENISLFQDVDFDENNIQNSNLYKYFTTKTK